MARVREFDTEAAVEAAMSAFRRTGYEGTSVQDLVDATGVGRGSLYAAFESKEGLYLAAMDRYREQYALPLIEITRSGTPARELIREILVSLVDEIVRDGSRQACLIVSAAIERLPHDPEVAVRVRSTTSSLEDALAEMIGEAQMDGQLAGTRDARDLARFLMMTIHGLRVTGAINPDRRSLMAVAEVALGCLD
ncbi:TetR/AcrR family transcriptional regulator [Nonomuraea fuscirosea]|uniref:TetR/AcrR family transcriptional regulator n=1 Tax=Nonomuraea fuscirosea TaxID=1291556 RepID=UPI002DD92CB0|nr:TetR/AcrR family transcriptional regulator [Nonomuraea fuscirosea]WSA57088.1 TetR/AcrR family transcriptional regulator [Nonomuraea fuscirosea]